LHQITSLIRIAAAALHDLNEPGLIRITDDVLHDVVAVVEDGRLQEQLRGFAPPLVLLWALAVAARRLLGLKPYDGNEPAVVGDPIGRPEPPDRAVGDLTIPAVQRLM